MNTLTGVSEVNGSAGFLRWFCEFWLFVFILPFLDHGKKLTGAKIEGLGDFTDRIDGGFHRAVFDHSQMGAGDSRKPAEYLLRETLFLAKRPDRFSQRSIFKQHEITPIPSIV